MNILLFSSFRGSWNGVRPEAEMFLRIARKGHTVILASNADTPHAKRFREKGITVVDCYPKRKISPGTIKQLRHIIREHDIDIVYATNSKTIPNAAFACIGLPVKMINYRGTSRGLYRHDPSAYLTHLHPRVDGISCNADAVRRNVVKQVWKNKDRVKTIYKGHDLSWFSNEKADLTSLGIPANARTAVCVANARPSKGVDMLIKSGAFLTDLKDLYILIVGEGVDSPAYLKLKNASPMADRIILAGFRYDAPQIIAAADLYIQPSIDREGMAKTIIEAMAQSVVPVGTDVGGTRELIEDGVCGYVIPPKDPQIIAEKIRHLIASPELGKRMGEAARKRIAEHFSVENSVDGHIAFFTEILEA